MSNGSRYTNIIYLKTFFDIHVGHMNDCWRCSTDRPWLAGAVM